MVSIRLDPRSERQFRNTMRDFEKLTKREISTGMKEMGRSAAKELANKVQPWGLTQAKGGSFMASIALQVSRAWFGARVGTWEGGTMEAAHRAARNSGGVVPKRQFRVQKKWDTTITESERDAYIKQMQKKAGRAKAAWIAAGQSLKVTSYAGGGTKLMAMPKMPGWIKRHVSSGYGTSTTTERGVHSDVSLTNHTPYISKLMPSSDVNAAMRIGYKRGFARIKKIIEAINRKAARL